MKVKKMLFLMNIKSFLSLVILLSSCASSIKIKFFVDVSLLPMGKTNRVIKIGLLDSGISSDYLGWFNEDAFQHPYDLIDGDNDVTTKNLHGTFLSLLMCGAKDDIGLCQYLQIVPIRIVDEVGVTTPDLVLKGLEYAKDQGCQIVNMSLGSGKFNQEISDMIDSFDESVLLFASVGDNSLDHYLFPASHEKVFAVGAADEDGLILPNSNVDNKPMILAPGKNLKLPLTNGEYTYKTGSSYATAIVSSLVGACMAYDCLSLKNLKDNDLYDENHKLSLAKLMNS